MSSINLDEYNAIKDNAVILDIRLDKAYQASEYTLPNSEWKDPSKIDEWIGGLPKDQKVIVYCVHGKSVSTSTVERLQSEEIDANYLEGGIEGFKELGAEMNISSK